MLRPRNQRFLIGHWSSVAADVVEVPVHHVYPLLKAEGPRLKEFWYEGQNHCLLRYRVSQSGDGAYTAMLTVGRSTREFPDTAPEIWRVINAQRRISSQPH